MKKTGLLLLVSVMLVGAVGMVGCSSSDNVDEIDISGTWTMVDTARGFMGTLSIIQDGTSLDGSYSGSGETGSLSGTIHGTTVDIVACSNSCGRIAGETNSAGTSMQGTYNSPEACGTFTATKLIRL